MKKATQEKKNGRNKSTKKVKDQTIWRTRKLQEPVNIGIEHQQAEMKRKS